MAPQDFEMCRANGGRIRTMKLSGGRYMHVCWDKKGKAHKGEIKMKKEMDKHMGTKSKKE